MSYITYVHPDDDQCKKVENFRFIEHLKNVVVSTVSYVTISYVRYASIPPVRFAQSAFQSVKPSFSAGVERIVVLPLIFIITVPEMWNVQDGVCLSR
jgi:hypothetical protein